MGKRKSQQRLVGFGAALAGYLATAIAAQAGDCTADQLDLRWDGGQAHFSVELATTEAERAKGLMDRDHLATGSGMLFIYPEPREVSFWMKNTRIPLDIAFIDDKGRVSRIAPMATPYDLTAIPSGAPVQYVLEINGGLANRLGITEGAELRHPAIEQELAVWPCAEP
ncbi:MAG: DUF192 domain-containing protein [Paracoccaceae bacterium]